jgi:hypothetical protein
MGKKPIKVDGYKRFDFTAIEAVIFDRIDKATKTRVKTLETQARSAVKDKAQQLFIVMTGAGSGIQGPDVFGVNSTPVGLGLKNWTPLKQDSRDRKSKQTGSDPNDNRYFMWHENLLSAIEALTPSKVFGVPKVSSDLVRHRKLKRGQQANYKLKIDPYPRFSAGMIGVGRKGAIAPIGKIEELMFSRNDPSRNFYKLVNRPTVVRTQRPFVIPYINWYINNVLKAAAKEALKK